VNIFLALRRKKNFAKTKIYQGKVSQFVIKLTLPKTYKVVLKITLFLIGCNDAPVESDKDTTSHCCSSFKNSFTFPSYVFDLL